METTVERPRRRSRNDPRRAATRERIIDATEELIRRGGSRSLTKAAVCREAGIHPSVIYDHFDSLEECVTSTAERLAARFTQRDAALRRATLDSSNPTLEDLSALIKSMLDLYAEDLRTSEFMFLCRYESSPVGKAVRRSIDNQIQLVLEDLMKTARALGVRQSCIAELHFCAVQSCEAVLRGIVDVIEDPSLDRQQLADRLAYWNMNACTAVIAHLVSQES